METDRTDDDRGALRGNAELNAQVVVWQGNITHLDVDAVVNAANQRLAAGSGICGAIFEAAGLRELQQTCWRDYPRGCPTGSMVVTSGCKLAARWIFHAVGPTREDAARLRACYRKCLDGCVAN